MSSALKHSWRAWLLLPALVLLGHLLLLDGIQMGVARFRAEAQAGPAKAWDTRILPAPAAQPAPAAPATPMATPTAPRKRAANPQAPQPPAQPATSADPESPAEPSGQPVAEVAQAADATSPASAAAPASIAAETPASAGTEASPDRNADAAIVPTAAPAKLPGSLRIGYNVVGEVKGLQYSARATARWDRDGDRYQAQLDVSVFLLGSRTQTSQGSISSTGLAPIRFADKWRGEQATHFRYDQGKLSFSANTPDQTLQPGTQDRLSLIMQLAGWLEADPGRYPSGTRLVVWVAGPRDADRWTLVVGEEEELYLPFGSVMARKLTRELRHAYDQRLEIWLAPKLQHLPVQLRYTQSNGDFVEQQMRVLEQP